VRLVGYLKINSNVLSYCTVHGTETVLFFSLFLKSVALPRLKMFVAGGYPRLNSGQSV
jgi:hypothetical protein